ncbi:MULTISPECIES: hypothetical protein [unclassified Tolypothrix]|uniref:hypothetical protein n=1 Tax=unclassified Tolypothrix TaxID=2649714 RepID=UPI0005EAB7D7|nr:MULTISPECIES: hypothetical protein [unclassified Tolypothrix]BAY94453.1 hypothetical protein NIES3275_65010 [Microchaete diplosiphon NIES-3275]EKF02836.1 hypothetical protein FDUTEX481_05637 [Tolypothrix sp. PCC 7601]MBE9087358.1 hypothetical protein [Tolypothrix sp. LEGE 11397]UYD28164.1 hypothetical protein HGR01_09075 [Tolypothrix sp. PCC 7712]UYD35959.1 hypothetical protein HG267_09515 [Tolypothrix sp. PCC 7601]
MTRQKRTSRVLEKAVLRAHGFKAIDPNMNFGEDCDLQSMLEEMEKLRNKLEIYNTALIVIDSTKSEIEEIEKTLGNISERLLLAVAWKYGNDSNEYKMAGAVRKSDRIRKGTATRLKGGTKAKPAEDTPTA